MVCGICHDNMSTGSVAARIRVEAGSEWRSQLLFYIVPVILNAPQPHEARAIMNTPI